MKISKYNHLIKSNDNKYFLYNALSGGLALLSEDDKNKFKYAIENIDNIENMDKKYVDELMKGKFINNNSHDEIEEIKYQMNLVKYNTKTLSLTILTTFNCNFRCTYCYEALTSYNTTKAMGTEVKKKILDFIEDKIINDKLLNLSVTWYGGEPLLELDSLLELSKNIREITDKYKVNFRQNIVTNGYLLTQDTYNKLVDIGIQSMQITLDGMEEQHDKRRFLADGKGTFKTIVDNIKKCDERINISIRVNVDKENVKDIYKFIDYISEFENRNFSIYFAATCDYSTDKNHNICGCYTTIEFSDIIINLYSYCLEKQIKVSYYPTYSPSICSAATLNSLVIEPDGTLQKCWNKVGQLENSIGNINNFKNIGQQNIIKWINFSPLNYEKCVECNILPICKGGCPHEAMRSEKKEPSCMEFKYNLEKLLNLRYKMNLLYKDTVI